MISHVQKKNMKREECQICISSILSPLMITCKYCQFKACETCVCTFLMEIEDDRPRCMNPECKKVWSWDFLATNTRTCFHNMKYRERRAYLLFQREKALLPGTQNLVEREKTRIKNNRQILSLQEEIDMFRHIIRQKRREINNLRFQVDDLENSEIKSPKIFNMACTVTDCRGFLSSSWKCGTCDTHVCKHCHVPKAGHNDPDHKCDENLVKTLKILKKDTKPCPSCKTGIYKINGCFGHDTPILLWNGETKMVQNIDTGDELIGDDGTKRTVLGLVDGKDKMYRVKQNKGDDYVVNSKHTLVLKFTGSKNIYWNKSGYWKMNWFDKGSKSKSVRVEKDKTKEDAYNEIKNFTQKLEVSDPVLITVEEYMKLPKSTKKKLFGYKTEGVLWEHKDVELDPYILGSWLGDGYSNGTGFCSNDTEIVEKWIKWANKNDCQVIDLKQKYRYYVRKNKEFKGKTNPFKNKLRKYNLINNKHIPNEYLINSREVRLQVLAGIIDTDGHVPKANKGRRITIIQSNPILSKQIKFLAQSLGLASTILTRKRQNDTTFTEEPRNYKDQQNINISGKYLDEIPTILPRKKCKAQIGGNDLLRTTISVEYIGIDDYYGFSVDKNKRFLLRDFTALKNCDQMYCTQCHTAFSWKKGTIERGVIHNPHFYEYQRRQNGGVAPRINRGFGCGGLVAAWEIEDHLTNLGLKEAMINGMYDCHRWVNHTRQVELPRYPFNIGDQDNSMLRVSYLMKNISEEKWKKCLKHNMKKQEKNSEIHQILDMYTTSMADIFRNIIECKDQKTFMKHFDSMHSLREYTNDSLQKISKRFGNVSPGIDATFKFWSNYRTMLKKSKNLLRDRLFE